MQYIHVIYTRAIVAGYDANRLSDAVKPAGAHNSPIAPFSPPGASVTESPLRQAELSKSNNDPRKVSTQPLPSSPIMFISFLQIAATLNELIFYRLSPTMAPVLVALFQQAFQPHVKHTSTLKLPFSPVTGRLPCPASRPVFAGSSCQGHHVESGLHAVAGFGAES